MKTKILCLKKLLDQINSLKSHLVETANLKGFTHSDTIKISQELDILLNKYQKNKYKCPV